MGLNSLNTLAELSGIKTDDLRAIAEQVKKNHAALNACGGHAFAAIKPGVMMTKYRCANCGGEVDHHAFHWYELGRTHAGKP